VEVTSGRRRLLLGVEDQLLDGPASGSGGPGCDVVPGYLRGRPTADPESAHVPGDADGSENADDADGADRADGSLPRAGAGHR
jgi:hypothetical protein